MNHIPLVSGGKWIPQAPYHGWNTSVPGSLPVLESVLKIEGKAEQAKTG